jgi:hypothetical protein
MFVARIGAGWFVPVFIRVACTKRKHRGSYNEDMDGLSVIPIWGYPDKPPHEPLKAYRRHSIRVERDGLSGPPVGVHVNL